MVKNISSPPGIHITNFTSPAAMLMKLDSSTHRTTPTLEVHESLSIFTMASDLATLVPVLGRGAIRFDPLRCLGGRPQNEHDFRADPGAGDSC
jgi:hypothetical protein